MEQSVQLSSDNYSIEGQFQQLNVQQPTAQDSDSEFQLLLQHSALGCLYNSIERFDPPRCWPETQEEVLETIERWVLEHNRGGGGAAALLWLFGPAGAGKSAISQTTIERCTLKSLYAASYFFSRTGMSNNSDGDRLIPTLVVQLCTIFPFLRRRVEKVIRDHPLIFSMTRRDQMEHLLVRPLTRKWQDRLIIKWRPPKALLIVLDGLDECRDPLVQVDILDVLIRALPLLPYPFRFLITSRPETHIRRVFHTNPSLRDIHFSTIDLSMNTVDEDIQNYLQAQFDEIRRTHPLRYRLDVRWPPREAIDTIVEQSSGQFIYASIVTKYVGHPKFHPMQRLDVVLGLHNPSSPYENPFAPLDALFMLIFDSVLAEDWPLLQTVFGILYLSTLQQYEYLSTSPRAVESYLGLESGALLVLLDDFMALLRVLDDPEEPIKVYHISTFQFLRDSARSKQYCLDLGLTHQVLAYYYMPSRLEGEDPVQSLRFLDHCHRATPSMELQKFLEDHPYRLSLNFDNRHLSYSPFIYAAYLSVLEREEYNEFGSLYSRQLAKLEEDLAELMPLQPVSPRLGSIDMGNKLQNEIHQVFTLLFHALSTVPEFPNILQEICELGGNSAIQDMESTTGVLKHILLAALPICHPSTVLYKIYEAFLRQLGDFETGVAINDAIKERFEAFMELQIPVGTDQAWESCQEAGERYLNLDVTKRSQPSEDIIAEPTMATIPNALDFEADPSSHTYGSFELEEPPSRRNSNRRVWPHPRIVNAAVPWDVHDRPTGATVPDLQDYGEEECVISNPSQAPYLRLVHPYLASWPLQIDLRQRDPLTLEGLYTTIYDYLNEPLKDVDLSQSSRGQAIYDTFVKRCKSWRVNPRHDAIRRIDFTLGRRIFYGLREVDEDPMTWELVLLPEAPS